MLIFNVDHLDPELLDSSRRASAALLMGGAAFHQLLATLESDDLKRAGEASRITANYLGVASIEFLQLAALLAERRERIKESIRRVNFDDAARDVHVSPNSTIVQWTNQKLVTAGLDGLFAGVAAQIQEFVAQLKDFSERGNDSGSILDRDYKLAHRLIREWRVTLEQGQYVSSICLAAATVTA